MEMDDDPDPEMQTGTPGHPISISSGSPFQGSPNRGPDSYKRGWSRMIVSPPPLPVEEPPQQPPQPPPEPPRRMRNAWISMRGGPRFSSPQGSSSYPPIPEDPQMGGPSNAMLENDPPPVSYAPPPPPMSFDNPIPTVLLEYPHLYPSSYPPVYPTGYLVQGYQYPPYQQPLPPQQQQTQEILERLDRVEHEANKTKKQHNSFPKGLASLIKGKKK
ncbi:leucine-rich repeat extensin-like protein 3 [Helianthus annuus]|uniref:leucine-rich repeat extensin-like protein 3 n=1 Tax=Helianthus annuus TaxID=4232 RepID=UPI000B8FB4A6|nr:leucine-rich repeat extensin-like protein 3 [Helianthus annuus]